jgi:hypothetical protein
MNDINRTTGFNSSPERRVIEPILVRLTEASEGKVLLDQAIERYPLDVSQDSFLPSHPAGRAAIEQLVNKPVEVQRTILDEPDFPVYETPTDQEVGFMHLDGLSNDSAPSNVTSMEQYRRIQAARQSVDDSRKAA